MTFAEQQRQAHIERQRRLGVMSRTPLPNRPANLAAPPLMPQPEATVSQRQAKVIEALEAEVAALAAQLKEVFDDNSPIVPSSPIKPVIRTVARYYRISLTDIASRRRSHALVRPRQVAMYLARELTRHSLPAIGRVLGRDHATVLHGCRRIEKLRLKDAELDAEIRALIKKLTR